MDHIKEGDDEREETSEDDESDIAEETDEEEESEESKDEATRLSESVFIYPNRKLSDHGNVFEGEIRSGIYGVRVCAIKIDRKSSQIVREAKILSKISSHTHVISIIESGIYKNMFEERVYIALDKCHEQNLQQHITHHKESGFEFNLKEALEYSKQLIAGLTYVHENLIIHKDLKPSNVLLSRDKSTIKLADFGLSQEIKSTSSKVYSKHQFGTNGFRPIESFGNNWVSLRSDTFSLGVVLYFVLSNGKSPFGDEISLWNYNIQNGVIHLSHLLVRNVHTFQHLIKAMLSDERCHRPSIWQVADHPCWTEKEVECNFDYNFSDEVDDFEVQIPEPGNQDSSNSETDIESRRQLFKALQKMGFDVSIGREPLIIIFDWNSKHLQRFNFTKEKLVTQIHEFNEEMQKSYRFSSISIGRYIYVLTERAMYRLKYDDVTARWNKLTNLISIHGPRPPAVVVSGAIYVVGAGGGGLANSVSKYNPSYNRWKILTSKHLVSRDSTIMASQGYVYCIGGRAEGATVTDRVERTNIVSQTWDEVSPMRQARSEASAVECNGKIIIAGGSTSRDRYNVLLNSVEKYDPDADQWTIMKSMKKTRFHFRCYFVRGSVYAVGGCQKRRTIEKYDAEKDEWKIFHNLRGMLINDSILAK